jgi:hypothetical protein
LIRTFAEIRQERSVVEHHALCTSEHVDEF